MAIRKRYQLLACTLALVAVLGYLSITSHTKPDSVQKLTKDGYGSAEKAFARASLAVIDYISSLGEGAPVIDSQFKATLHSKSKIWTVEGYAYSADDHRSYRWTVLLDYYGVQDWEILEKIVTPVFAAPVSGEVEGVSQTEGELFQADPND